MRGVMCYPIALFIFQECFKYAFPNRPIDGFVAGCDHIVAILVFITAVFLIPVIGADYLKHFGLLLDVKNQKLLNSMTIIYVKGITSHIPSPSFNAMTIKSDHIVCFDKILRQNPEITQPTCSEVAVKHSTTHHIDMRGPPVTHRPC